MSFSETHNITDLKNTLTLQQLDFMQSYAGFFPIGLGLLTYSIILINISFSEERRWGNFITLTVFALLGTLLIASSIVGTRPVG